MESCKITITNNYNKCLCVCVSKEGLKVQRNIIKKKLKLFHHPFGGNRIYQGHSLLRTNNIVRNPNFSSKSSVQCLLWHPKNQQTVWIR